MKRNEFTLISALLIAATLIVPFLMPVCASVVTLANDPLGYGGWMDAKELSMDLNSTHITLILSYYGSMPDRSDVFWQCTFYFDVDQSLSTGSNYNEWGMGVEYYIYTCCYGDGYTNYGSIYKWNASSSYFDWVPNPPDFQVLFSAGEDHFNVIIPLSSIELSQNPNFYVKAQSYSYIYDYGQTFSYTVSEDDDIVVDGDPGDWGELPPKFLDPVNIQPAEFDMSAFYTTNNETNLHQRLDVAGSPTLTPPEDIMIQRSIRIYYDTDNNASTGYSIAGIGADYRSRLYLYLDQYGKGQYTYFYWYNQSSGSFKNIDSFPSNWNSVFEWSIPLSMLGVSSGSPIKIYVDYIYSYIFDYIPDGNGRAFYIGRPTLYQSFLFTENSVRMVYPSDSPTKPLGCSSAMVSDWLSSMAVSTRLPTLTEGLDTEPDFVDPSTGKPVGQQGIGIVSFGGPIVNPVVKYAEGEGTPSNDRAPIRFHAIGDTLYFQHWNGTGIPGANLPSSVINNNQDMFVIEVYRDGDSRFIMLAYGFGWKGTYAAGKYYDRVICADLDSYRVSWVIVRWDDADGNGFVNNPEDGDMYTIVASG